MIPQPVTRESLAEKHGKGHDFKAFYRRDFNTLEEHFPAKDPNFLRLPPGHSRAMVKGVGEIIDLSIWIQIATLPDFWIDSCFGETQLTYRFAL